MNGRASQINDRHAHIHDEQTSRLTRHRAPVQIVEIGR